MPRSGAAVGRVICLPTVPVRDPLRPVALYALCIIYYMIIYDTG